MAIASPLDIVTTKFREARLRFERLSTIQRAEEFYATANAFVTATRSVLYVSQHQFGWKERPKQRAYSMQEERERKAFDAWFDASPEVKAVLSHPLSRDRHDVIHRSGQAGFIHIPKPSNGMAVGHGTPFKQAHWFGPEGLGGLPLRDDNFFYYADDLGANHDAMPYCEAYLDLIRGFFDELRRRPCV